MKINGCRKHINGKEVVDIKAHVIFKGEKVLEIIAENYLGMRGK